MKKMKNLKTVMLINAVSSGATGLLLILLSGYISNLFGSTNAVTFNAVGIFLLLFSVFVFILSMKKVYNTGAVKAIIAMDAIWVGSSLIILITNMFSFTLVGNVITGGVALWVLLMAVLQAKGLKQILSINS